MKKSPISRTDDNSTDESSRSNRDDRKSYRSWDDDRGSPLTIQEERDRRYWDESDFGTR